jgi:coatomer subunit beta'
MDTYDLLASTTIASNTRLKVELRGEPFKNAPQTNTAHALQRQLFARSERVKGIDFHPVEPWILTTLYSGMWAGAQEPSSLLI